MIIEYTWILFFIFFCFLSFLDCKERKVFQRFLLLDLEVAINKICS